MKHVTLLLLLSILLVSAYSDHSDKVEWDQKPIVCPLCKAGNMLGIVKSCGDYIYHWPSKFQYVFWPHTDSHFWYSCKDCGLTCYMTDFNPLLFPEAKRMEMLTQLRAMARPRYLRDYNEIPTSQRILIAEQLYKTWEKDDIFWCEFYRVKGYHFAKEADSFRRQSEEARRQADVFLTNNNNFFQQNVAFRILSVVARPLAKLRAANRAGAQAYLSQMTHFQKLATSYQKIADEARRKSLEMASEIMKKPESQGITKELLYISGAMHHYLGDDAKALEDFRQASKLNYHHPRMGASSKQYDEYLGELLREYIALIENKEKIDGHDHSG